MTTPAQRQTARVNAGTETAHSELAPNGRLFTLKGGAPQAGSVGYGTDRRTHSVGEAASDGGVQTKDRNLASSLRGMGIYNEVVL